MIFFLHQIAALDDVFQIANHVANKMSLDVGLLERHSFDLLQALNFKHKRAVFCSLRAIARCILFSDKRSLISSYVLENLQHHINRQEFYYTHKVFEHSFPKTL